MCCLKVDEKTLEAFKLDQEQKEQPHNDSKTDELVQVKMVNRRLIVKLPEEQTKQELNFRAEVKLVISNAPLDPASSQNDPVRVVKNDKSTETDQDQQKSFVWKTIKERDDLDFNEMILGTYEQNTANCFMIHTFFGRLFMKDNYKLMAKVKNKLLFNKLTS